MNVEPFEVWWAYIRFEDASGGKKRPVIVYHAGDAGRYAIIPLTTHAPRNCPGEFPLLCYREAGLTEPSVARCSHIFDIRESYLIKKIGKLHMMDIISLNSIISRMQGRG